MLFKVNSNSNHYLFSVHPSASTRAAWSLKEVSRRRSSHFERCFQPSQVRMWNNLQYIVFDTGTLGGCSQPLVASPSCVFFRFPWRRCLWGCESNLQTILYFLHGNVLLHLIIIIIKMLFAPIWLVRYCHNEVQTVSNSFLPQGILLRILKFQIVNIFVIL